MVHTNNITGTSVPAKEIVEEVMTGEPWCFDGARRPRTRIDVKDLDVDIFTFSAHKMPVPPEWACYTRRWRSLRMEPLIGEEEASA